MLAIERQHGQHDAEPDQVEEHGEKNDEQGRLAAHAKAKPRDSMMVSANTRGE